MNNRKYIFIFSHSRQIDWYSVFAEAYKSLGEQYVTVLFVHGAEDYKRAQKYSCYDVVVDILFDFDLAHEDYSVSPEFSTVKKLENRLGKSFLWEDIQTDRWARNSSHNLVIRYMEHTTELVARYYKDLDPALALGEWTMALYRFAYRLFKADDKPMLYPITTRYYSRLYFETELDWVWESCIQKYRDFIGHGTPRELEAQVSDLYAKLAGETVAKPNYMTSDFLDPVGYTRVRNIGLRQAILKVLRTLGGGKIDRNNIRHANLERGYLSKVKRLIHERVSHKQYRVLATSQINIKGRYAVYFLHYQPEYTSDALGKKFQDQRVLIKLIASALPSDVSLVVKEHPTMIGLRPKEYHKQILRLPNVLLAASSADSGDLIKRSDLVFTIVGTPALEAMFVGKPAIMFAKYAFCETNSIRLCTNIEQLDSLVRSQLEWKASPSEVRANSIALLAAKFVASKPGQIPVSEDLISAFLSDDQQTTLVKQSFLEELQEKGLVN